MTMVMQSRRNNMMTKLCQIARLITIYRRGGEDEDGHRGSWCSSIANREHDQVLTTPKTALCFHCNRLFQAVPQNLISLVVRTTTGLQGLQRQGQGCSVQSSSPKGLALAAWPCQPLSERWAPARWVHLQLQQTDHQQRLPHPRR